ncbi:MAG: glycosyltransferase [Bacteroidia bacterium]|nr:glycosyltransferase [Bacteroidia bacterium]
MKNNRIVIVSLSLALGGTEKESSTIASLLSSKGYQIKYISAYKLDHFFKLNEKIEYVEPNFTRQNLNSFFYLIRLLRFLRKEIKLYNPRVIISFNEWINPFVLLAALGLKTKIFVRDLMHPKAHLPFLVKYIKKILYPYSTMVIAQTNYAKNIIENLYGFKKIVVIPTRVSFVDFTSKIKSNRVITIGRLDNIKGHKYLIEAFHRVNCEDWELHLVGEGPLLEELSLQCKKLGINKKVVFHGKVQNFDELLANSSIFVLPSLREGFPNALIEAMSVPLPCISSDFYEGRNEIIEHGKNGFVFNVGDVDSLSELLKTLMFNPDLRNVISDEALNIRGKFSSEMVDGLYLKLIEDEF